MKVVIEKTKYRPCARSIGVIFRNFNNNLDYEMIGAWWSLRDFYCVYKTCETLISDSGELKLFRSVWAAGKPDLFFDQLCHQTPWKQPEILIAGNRVKIPRLQAWYGDPGASYRYSGLLMQPLTWTDSLNQVKQRVEQVCEMHFNSALVNCYRNGNDSVGWHSDDESELGRNPVIASVSLGATRRFQLQHRSDSQRKFHVDLLHGDLLVMQGEFQHHWRHQLPKTKKQVGKRINITFRWVKMHQKSQEKV